MAENSIWSIKVDENTIYEAKQVWKQSTLRNCHNPYFLLDIKKGLQWKGSVEASYRAFPRCSVVRPAFERNSPADVWHCVSSRPDVLHSSAWCLFLEPKIMNFLLSHLDIQCAHDKSRCQSLNYNYKHVHAKTTCIHVNIIKTKKIFVN